MKKILVVLVLICVTAVFTGCGETVNGISKDIKRVGKGIKTIFIRDSE